MKSVDETKNRASLQRTSDVNFPSSEEEQVGDDHENEEESSGDDGADRGEEEVPNAACIADQVVSSDIKMEENTGNVAFSSGGRSQVDGGEDSMISSEEGILDDEANDILSEGTQETNSTESGKKKIPSLLPIILPPLRQDENALTETNIQRQLRSRARPGAQRIRGIEHNYEEGSVLDDGTVSYPAVSGARNNDDSMTIDQTLVSDQSTYIALTADLAPDEDQLVAQALEQLALDRQLVEEYGQQRIAEASRPPFVEVVKIEEDIAGHDIDGRDSSQASKRCEREIKYFVLLTGVGIVAIVGIWIFFSVREGSSPSTTPSPSMSLSIAPSIPQPIPPSIPPSRSISRDIVPPTQAPLVLATPSPSSILPIPTAPPAETERFELLWNSIGPDIAQDPMALRNPKSPQYTALEWLANQDPASSNISDASAAILKERYAILVLVFQNGQAANLGALGFMSALPVCLWYDDLLEKGIKCNGPWVSEIALRDSNLQGGIPSEIGLLKNLTVLDIDANFFIGTFPISLSALSNLLVFWALNNELTGSLPPEVGLMTSLTSFDVGQNAMTGTIPTEMGANPSMLEVYFHENRFKGNLPTEFGNLQRMEVLSLFSNELTGTIPTEYGNIKSMRVLAMDNNHLTGTLPTELGRLVNMEEFYVYQNRLEGTVPTEFSSLTQLSWLELDSNFLTGTLDPIFCDIPRMQPWASFYADCRRGREIICSCCTHCCNVNRCFLHTRGDIALP